MFVRGEEHLHYHKKDCCKLAPLWREQYTYSDWLIEWVSVTSEVEIGILLLSVQKYPISSDLILILK